MPLRGSPARACNDCWAGSTRAERIWGLEHQKITQVNVLKCRRWLLIGRLPEEQRRSTRCAVNMTKATGEVSYRSPSWVPFPNWKPPGKGPRRDTAQPEAIGIPAEPQRRAQGGAQELRQLRPPVFPRSYSGLPVSLRCWPCCVLCPPRGPAQGK